MLLAVAGGDKRRTGAEVGDGFFDQRLVGGWEPIRAKLFRFHPAAGLAFEGLDLARLVGADERGQANEDLRGVVLDGRKLRDRAGGDGELFAQLACEALMKGFPRLALSAGEFPESAEGVVVFPLADQDFPAADDQRDGGVDATLSRLLGAHLWPSLPG